MMKNFYFKLKTVAMIIILFVTIKTQAQQDTIKDIFDMSLEELMNIEVISSTKFAQKQSLAPNVISIVTKKTINNYDWHSMNDALFKQAGFSLLKILKEPQLVRVESQKVGITIIF